jgi:hypothetical protein
MGSHARRSPAACPRLEVRVTGKVAVLASADRRHARVAAAQLDALSALFARKGEAR